MKLVAPTIEETRLEIIKLACAQTLDRHDLRSLDVDILFRELGHALAFELVAYIAGRHAKGQEIRYTKTWWDAFKARWFPRWALLRWPPAFVVITPELTEYFPDLKPLRGQRSMIVASFSQERVELWRP